MEESKLPSFLIIAAGLVVAYFLWKRAKDAPAFGGTETGFSDGVRTATDPPPSSTGDRPAGPGFGGAVNTTTKKSSIGGASTNTSARVSAPVTRGSPPRPTSGAVPTTSNTAPPAPTIYAKPSSTLAASNSLITARLTSTKPTIAGVNL